MTPNIQNIRDGFDELFKSSSIILSDTSKQLFDAIGIGDFAKIYMQSKKHGFAASQKVLTDLVKLSFVIYQNTSTLPIQKKVILPAQDGNYKFIITSLPYALFRSGEDKNITDAIGNTHTIALVCTGDDMHAKIAQKCGLTGGSDHLHVFGGAWIDIHYGPKIINIHSDSGNYGSCSNQLVQWMMQEYIDQGYHIMIDMDHQQNFFETKK